MTVVDVKALSPAEREKLKKEILRVEEEEKNAYKTEFVDNVVKLAIDKGVRWSEAVALLQDYKPDTDAKAKKMGFGFKGKNKEGKTVYYVRKMKGATEL
ncbi:hypothetical protein GV827_05900 [Sulfitobacter sp. JBTF-M27]|uniref:Uncharacterized protein n=1 Tax=Sulfitobacter sediminilitoris TaxID=2698830 RepID=A0A6P0C733_9RHOB|nr:hypothetical protein [Sulfitobacter sediminilitoris]NEK21932.1 hypothetical protein [Sulfitobacter sediminilitoris]